MESSKIGYLDVVQEWEGGGEGGVEERGWVEEDEGESRVEMFPGGMQMVHLVFVAVYPDLNQVARYSPWKGFL